MTPFPEPTRNCGMCPELRFPQPTSFPASAPGTFHSTVCAVLNLTATCTDSPETMLWNSACSSAMSDLISGPMKISLSASADSPNLRSMLFESVPTSAGS